jgi:SpoVK/Ycf46/Vps4 family AAA+-type ATPase
MFRRQLADRPMSAIDTNELADRSQGFSGADIALVCEAAAERALLDSVRTGTVRLIDMDDLRASMAEVVPSTGSWMETAKTIVQYGEDDGTFAELRTYLKRSRRW